MSQTAAVAHALACCSGSVDETVKCWQQDSADAGVLDHQQTWTGHTLGVIALDVDALGQAACSSALDSFIRVRLHLQAMCLAC